MPKVGACIGSSEGITGLTWYCPQTTASCLLDGLRKGSTSAWVLQTRSWCDWLTLGARF